MKVLVVDYDSLVAMSLKTILSSDSEIEVAGCGNSGQDAIAMYENNLKDLEKEKQIYTYFLESHKE